MIRHAECTRNKKQNRRNYKGFGRIKTRHYDFNRNEEKKEMEQKYQDLTYTFIVEFQKRKEQKKRVPILLKKRHKRHITTWEAINENMIKLHMNLFGKKLCILGIYAISDDENAV